MKLLPSCVQWKKRYVVISATGRYHFLYPLRIVMLLVVLLETDRFRASSDYIYKYIHILTIYQYIYMPVYIYIHPPGAFISSHRIIICLLSVYGNGKVLPQPRVPPPLTRAYPPPPAPEDAAAHKTIEKLHREVCGVGVFV